MTAVWTAEPKAAASPFQGDIRSLVKYLGPTPAYWSRGMANT